ncbi:MAG: 2Fe-2S iron-sulfur cluster-binding protein [Hymenobacteraceae bacterium]|nr:2Fe-2S iron-sulfur cluster-binding protein [Hymenobacteraceae bacterium]MDX5397971.1 2Fe-2S iron-sulfur cluster-binding protein [Hymenobacteraceae bacterium]MDX5443796.1 2Fe-2S iron-sulfur cluster-binding protein [Hymenobacteraceae bacterium]MDX5514043.1 2Fe-2S iron-sulfur cluster-binding protein [Hymenobacteraceae bacterium]
MSEITIKVEAADGSVQEITAPTDMGLSLMEVLKAHDYNIQATCGGMALCATCHVVVLEHEEALNPPEDDELYQLENLPDAVDSSRLSCQIKLRPELDGITVRIVAES